MKNAFCCMVLGAGCLITSCDVLPFDTMGYTLIEVRNDATGEVVTGAVVLLHDAWLDPFPILSPVTVAPTNQEGRTFLAVFREGMRPFSGTLQLTITFDGMSTDLSVENRESASVSDGQLTITVIDTLAPSPPPPTLRVLPATSPPTVELGYVGFVGACELQSGSLIWDINCSGVPTGTFYPNSAEVGIIPEGCIDELARFPQDTIQECPIDRAGRGSGGQFIVYATLPFGEATFVSPPYCLDEQERVIECP